MIVPTATSITQADIYKGKNGMNNENNEKEHDPDILARTAVECTPRNGLPRFFAKLQANAGVKIAYFGGSITAAPGWRVFSREWFSNRHPDCEVGEVHAAIGGTGSTLGAYRLAYDVLKARPDLMFVEFAVNDSGAETKRILENIEGIVRHAWEELPDLEICFVYTLAHKEMLEELQSGRFPRAASVMEIVADRYGIPSIHLGPEIAERVRNHRLVFKGSQADFDENGRKTDGTMLFSEDGVHPLVETGHRIYAEVIARSMNQIESVKPVLSGAHYLGVPLTKARRENARVFPLSKEWMKNGWRKLVSASESPATEFSHRLPELWAGEPGASFSFTFSGTDVGFYDLLGPDCGGIQVSIDGKPVTMHPRFDPYCTYHRLGGIVVAAGLEDRRHIVEVSVDTAHFDKRNILFEHNRPDMDAHPEKYTDARWYVGGVMLMGKVE
jgi:hypothetical protein